MSYSFTARGATRDAVKQDAFERMTRVCDEQPVHNRDRDQAMMAVGAFVDLMADAPEGSEHVVSVSGYVSVAGDQTVNACSVNVSCGLAAATVPSADAATQVTR